MMEEKHGKSLHKTDKKMLRKPKNTGMTNKNTANSIHKTQKIPEKNRDDGEKTRRAPAQDRQKKMLRDPKNTGMADKKRQVASAKRKRFRMKNRDDGEKTRRAPAQNRQKNAPGTEKYQNG